MSPSNRIEYCSPSGRQVQHSRLRINLENLEASIFMDYYLERRLDISLEGIMKDIHLILPDASAAEVDRLARTFNETRNGLIRRALEQFFESERKRIMAERMRRYAEEMARESGEFVKETEKMVAQKLLRDTRW